MSLILIAHPEGSVRELLHIVLDLNGDQTLDHDQPNALERDDVDALIVEPDSPDCLLSAQRLREARPDLPIVCVSTHRPTPKANDLRPVAYLLMPFRLNDFDGAMRLALGR